MGAWHMPVVLLLCLSTVYAASCPSECSCTTDAAKYKVDCSKRGLTTVPQLPSETTDLDLSGNGLPRLDEGLFTGVVALSYLDISDNKLTDIHINAFLNLANLRTLNLSHNSLQASTFLDLEVFRGCRYITKLDLSHNELRKIPDSGLRVLTNLEQLFIASNSITNPTFGSGFQSLENIKLVDLSSNNFQQIPRDAFTFLMDRIKIIRLRNCGIRSIQTGAFQSLDKLTHFDISDNERINQRDLNATIAAVCKPSLLSLSLSNVNISNLNYVLNPVLGTDNLTYLDLSHNALQTLGVSDLRPAKKLTTLNLSNNKLTQLPSLGLSRLKQVDVSHNEIVSISNSPFEVARELKEVDLSYNKLIDFPSDEFSSNNQLLKLDLSYNSIRMVPNLLLETVTELTLRGNSINDPTNIFYMPSLNVLDLGANKITIITNDMMTGELALLNLTENQIDHIETGSFAARRCPKILDLSHNELSSLDSWGLVEVETLYLHHNQLQNIRDSDLEQLKALEKLDLSDNMIKTLPTSLLIHLSSLTELNLASNQLSSYFQGDFGRQMLSQRSRLLSLNLSFNNIAILQLNLFSNLAMLRHLDLSHNQIEKIMSDQFQDLGVLRILNLGYNRLNGFNHTIVTPLVSLETLDLSGTLWQCDCELADVKKWMDTTEVELVGYEDYTCSGPQSMANTKLQDYKIEDDSSCSSTVMEKTIILIIIGCTSFVILVVAAIIFWQHRWRLKKKLKKQHYRAMCERAQMPLPNNNDSPITQTEYHPHPHHHLHHHSHSHTPNLPQKPVCPEHHHHNGQAYV